MSKEEIKSRKHTWIAACPRCSSADIRYLRKSERYYCRRCGYEWTYNLNKASKDYGKRISLKGDVE